VHLAVNQATAWLRGLVTDKLCTQLTVKKKLTALNRSVDPAALDSSSLAACNYITGLLTALYIRVLVNRKIRFGTPDVPGFQKSRQDISDIAYENFDFHILGWKINRRRTATDRPLAGRNRKGRVRV
jgi:hypothetical protein